MPLNALAVASIMQTAPSALLLDQLLMMANHTSRPNVCLYHSLSRWQPDFKSSPKRIDVAEMQAYVNRVLLRWMDEWYSSAAQNANSKGNPNTPWILDRGGWNMTYINKAFN
ncbi:hypothetical protein PHMEG_00035288 [Phytophthora megakarya]|uniref:Uncharacterized protein n=1 Tax=Phytophthora megakarya TaxID=4795 RepID=A0A225UPC9_9STRA|nr:hypothetical protein PHMEG_00035288 [Phytophthora megakarya]